MLQSHAAGATQLSTKALQQHDAAEGRASRSSVSNESAKSASGQAPMESGEAVAGSMHGGPRESSSSGGGRAEDGRQSTAGFGGRAESSVSAKQRGTRQPQPAALGVCEVGSVSDPRVRKGRSRRVAQTNPSTDVATAAQKPGVAGSASGRSSSQDLLPSLGQLGQAGLLAPSAPVVASARDRSGRIYVRALPVVAEQSMEQSVASSADGGWSKLGSRSKAESTGVHSMHRGGSWSRRTRDWSSESQGSKIGPIPNSARSTSSRTKLPALQDRDRPAAAKRDSAFRRPSSSGADAMDPPSSSLAATSSQEDPIDSAQGKGPTSSVSAA